MAQAELVLSTKGLSSAQQAAVISEAGLLATTGELTTAQITEALTTKKRSASDATQLAIQTGLITANASEATSTNIITAEKLEELVATKALTQAEAELIAAKAGINFQNTTSLFSGLKTTLSGLGSGIMAVASAHPVIAAITVAIAACGTAALVAKKKHEAAAKAIKENYENAKTAISEIKENLETTISKTDEIKEEYAELAQGVDLLTNANKSLSSENYERFLELSNELSNLYPSLTQSYDENGNAILNLSGNVGTIVDSLDSLIEKERQLANQEILKQMPDLFKGYATNVSDYKDNLKEAEKTQSEVQAAYEKLTKYGVQLAFDSQGHWGNSGLTRGDFKQWLETIGISVKETTLKDAAGIVGGLGLETVDGAYLSMQDVHDAYVSAFNSATEDVKYAKQQLENETSSINEYLNSWLQSEFTYNQVEDSGLQKAIQDMLFNFDWDSLPDTVDSSDWDAVSEYLRRNILFAIKNAQGDEEISNALSEVFSNAELDVGDKIDYIKQIQDYFGEDNVISLYLQPELEESEILQSNLDKAVQQYADQRQEIQDELVSYNGENTIDFIARPVIDTSELEKAGWTDVGDGKATVFSRTYTGEGGKKAIVVTPILPDGTVLSEADLEAYANDLLAGKDIQIGDKYTGKDITLKMFEGDDPEKVLDEAEEFAERVHNLHEEYFLGDIESFFKEESINTQEELDYWLEVTEGATSAAEAVEMYKKAKEEATAKKSVDELKSGTNSIISNIDKITEILNSQSGGSSLSLDDYNSDELKAYQSALELVNGTMQLNADKVKEIVQAKVEEQTAVNETAKAYKQAEYLRNAAEIEKLNRQLKENADTEDESAEAIQAQIDALKSSNDTIASECTQIDLLNSELQESIGLYQQWKDAQNAPESGDMFDDALTAVKMINDTLNDTSSDIYGRVGRADYKASVDFLVPDSVDKTDKDAVRSYLKSISGLFMYDENGDQAGLNIEEFCRRAVEAGLMELDKATGSYSPTGVYTLDEWAEKLKMAVPLIQAMFGEIQEFMPEDIEWATVFDSAEEEAVSLIQRAEEIQKQIDEINNSDIELDVKDEQLSELQDELDGINSRKLELEWPTYEKVMESAELEVQISEASSENVYNELLAKKEQLEEPTEVEIGLATDYIDGQISALEAEIQKINDEHPNIEAEADTSEAKTEFESLNAEIEQLKAEKEILVKAKYVPENGEESEGETETKGLTANEIINKIISFACDGSAEAKAEIQEIDDMEIGDKTFTVTMEGKETALNDVKEIDDTTIGDKIFDVIVHGVEPVINKLNKVITKLSEIPTSKTITITTVEKSSGGGGGNTEPETEFATAEGTATLKGASFAQ